MAAFILPLFSLKAAARRDRTFMDRARLLLPRNFQKAISRNCPPLDNVRFIAERGRRNCFESLIRGRGVSGVRRRALSSLDDF